MKKKKRVGKRGATAHSGLPLVDAFCHSLWSRPKFLLVVAFGGLISLSLLSNFWENNHDFILKSFQGAREEKRVREKTLSHSFSSCLLVPLLGSQVCTTMLGRTGV